MLEYYVPTGEGSAELVEKRSRFIGHVWRIESEDEARERIAEMKSKYHDARHNCWCCIVSSDGTLRYSDDGEPQGTAGQPMLEMFRKAGITDVCCVVTRYFGGILLGTGGLLRAYTQTAKLALDDAGISVVRMWECVSVLCEYSLFERAKLEILAVSGVVTDTEYSDNVRIAAVVPENSSAALFDRIREISSGKAVCSVTGTEFRSVPLGQK